MTETFDVVPLALSRLARSSGQRLLAFVVEPRPSVMESPSTTMPLADASAMTSIPDRMYQSSACIADDMLAALTVLLPVCSKLVVRDPGCPVTLLGVVPNATVTDRLLSAARLKSSASDQTAWFWGIVTDGIPENASALSVAVSMVLSTGLALHTATCAALMVTDPLPNSFEKRTRIWLPPSDTCVTWRRVLFDSDAGGLFAVSVSCGAPVPVPTQWVAPVPPPVPLPPEPDAPPRPATPVP